MNSFIIKFALVACLATDFVEGGRGGSSGSWRRRMLDNDHTDFCANYAEWGTFYDTTNRVVMYDDESYFQVCKGANGNTVDDADCGLVTEKSEESTFQALCETPSAANNDKTCSLEHKDWADTTEKCTPSGTGSTSAADCTARIATTSTEAECESPGGNADTECTFDNTGNTRTDPISQSESCGDVRGWADESSAWLAAHQADADTAEFKRIQYHYIVLENHFGCCTMREGSSTEILGLLTRIRTLCATYDVSVCSAVEDTEDYRDCANMFEVCPAVTAPEGEEGLDLDAIGNYGAVVLEVNENFSNGARRRRMQDDSETSCMEKNRIHAGTDPEQPVGEGRATLMLSWGTEHYGGQLGHVALIIGDIDPDTEQVPDDKWVSFGPASNDSNYQSPSALGDVFDLLQGMRSHISKFNDEYGLFDDYFTIHSVNEDAMIAAWEKIRERPGRYSLIDRNCMTVVAEVLNAGMDSTCGLETRNLITPSTFFSSAKSELEGQIWAGEADKQTRKLAFAKAYTQKAEVIPKCGCDADSIPRNQQFACQRTNYVSERIPITTSVSRQFVAHPIHERTKECSPLKDPKNKFRAQTATDNVRLTCGYGSLCSNPNYQPEKQGCGDLDGSRIDCVNAEEFGFKCMYVEGHCVDYTPGDCDDLGKGSGNDLTYLQTCTQNAAHCELSYNSGFDITCKDRIQKHCPSLGMFPKTNDNETVSVPCSAGFIGEKTRTCDNGKWGPINRSNCIRVPRRVFGTIAGGHGRRLADRLVPPTPTSTDNHLPAPAATESGAPAPGL